MNTAQLCRFLLWCSILNLTLVTVWFLAFAFARETIFRLHSRWFKLPADRFDELHYSMIGHYKLLILFFNVIPLLALWIAR